MKKNNRYYLGWMTVGLIYLLMVWGNIVSSTGSGLACPDWPLCHGSLTPPPRPDIILEWGHRILAFIGSVFIILTLCQVFFSSPNHQDEQRLRKSGKSLLFLLGLQVLLGGITVLLHLSPTISTIHLMIASLVFGGIIIVACVMTWPNPVLENTSPKIKRLALAGLGAMLIQLLLGGLVRHNHLGLACPNFPNCLNSFFPIPLTFGTALTFTHRWWGVLMLGLFFHLAKVASKTQSPLQRVAQQAFALSVGQIILGIGTVVGSLHTHTRATHAAIGYLIWGLLVYIAVRAGGLRWFWEPKRSHLIDKQM